MFIVFIPVHISTSDNPTLKTKYILYFFMKNIYETIWYTRNFYFICIYNYGNHNFCFMRFIREYKIIPNNKITSIFNQPTKKKSWIRFPCLNRTNNTNSGSQYKCPLLGFFKIIIELRTDVFADYIMYTFI